MTKGFIYVGSVQKLFYNMACMSALSLKDCSPDADITLFTHENFVDKKADIFDNIITDIPVHVRAKMWCSARSPYDYTVYLDSDTLIYESEIIDMLEYPEKHLLSFQNLNTGVSGEAAWQYVDHDMQKPMIYHGGVYAFRKDPLTQDFMQTWFDAYVQQVNEWNFDEYNPVNKDWDMLTLWRLFNEPQFERFHNVDVGIIDNKFNHSPWESPVDKIVVQHYTKMNYFYKDKTNASFAVEKSENNGDTIIYR